MTRDDLIKQLEQAQGPDRELDRDIELAFGKCCAPQWEKHRTHENLMVHIESNDWLPAFRYTASIDAALTLVPEGLDWDLMCVTEGETKPPYEATVYLRSYMTSTKDDECFGWSSTPAIALCIAALRARATPKPYSDIDRLKEKGMRFVEE